MTSAERTRLEIEGREVPCPVCGEREFFLRHVQLNTGAMTFFGLDWANRSAECYVCARCTHMLWFDVDMPEAEQL